MLFNNIIQIIQAYEDLSDDMISYTPPHNLLQHEKRRWWKISKL